MPRENELKRKLRSLKKLELGLRFPRTPPDPGCLVWSKFFSDHPGSNQIKYPFDSMLNNDQYRRQAMDDFITTLYYQYYKERGMLDGVVDPLGLTELGLAPDAGPEEIKARFRTLAKKHHPDVGGNHDKMIELLKLYHKLLGK